MKKLCPHYFSASSADVPIVARVENMKRTGFEREMESFTLSSLIMPIFEFQAPLRASRQRIFIEPE